MSTDSTESDHYAAESIDPYRTPAPEKVEDQSWPFPQRWYLRPVCWVRDHAWHIVRSNSIRVEALGYLHPLAGRDAQCRRCGITWEDTLHGCYLLPKYLWCEKGPYHEGACEGFLQRYPEGWFGASWETLPKNRYERLLDDDCLVSDEHL